jgi:polyisoprenoid-binding protein YceI
MSRRLGWILGVVIALVIAVPAGTFVYIHFVEGDAPAPLSLDTKSAADGSSSPVPTGGISGTWTPTADSVFRYRVNEVLFGQNATAVGSTSKVDGTMVINDTTVSEASLTVDMASVSSDRAQRDNQFRNRIMDVASFPTATFELSQPIQLPGVPNDASTVSVRATGVLTLHGTPKTVTVDLAAQRSGQLLKVNGSIPVVFADYNIPNPTFGPVSTDDHGVLELLVVFQKNG